jgi:hypothetical protein
MPTPAHSPLNEGYRVGRVILRSSRCRSPGSALESTSSRTGEQPFPAERARGVTHRPFPDAPNPNFIRTAYAAEARPPSGASVVLVDAMNAAIARAEMIRTTHLEQAPRAAHATKPDDAGRKLDRRIGFR